MSIQNTPNMSELKRNLDEAKQANQFLQKTITVKNKHIQELIEELKKTQDLHQSLKKKYQTDEHKIKQKTANLHDLVNQLKKENEEVTKKCKKLQQKSQEDQVKNKQLLGEWDQQMKEINGTIIGLKIQNQNYCKQNWKIKKEIQVLVKKNQQISRQLQQNEQKIGEKELIIIEKEEKMAKKEREWKLWNQELAQNLKTIENKTVSRKKNTLDQLQSRIKDIMIDL